VASTDDGSGYRSEPSVTAVGPRLSRRRRPQSVRPHTAGWASRRDDGRDRTKSFARLQATVTISRYGSTIRTDRSVFQPLLRSGAEGLFASVRAEVADDGRDNRQCPCRVDGWMDRLRGRRLLPVRAKRRQLDDPTAIRTRSGRESMPQNKRPTAANNCAPTAIDHSRRAEIASGPVVIHSVLQGGKGCETT